MSPFRAAPILVLLMLPARSRAQEAVPAAWRATYDLLVQSVCTGRDGAVLAGVSPLDGVACPVRRKLRLDEALPYHKQDWAPITERDLHPSGLQRSDSLPVRTALGVAVLQTHDFGDQPRRLFNRFDEGDGGQVAFFTSNSAAYGLTEDGGAGLQFFLGPECRPLDSWIIVDAGFPARQAGQTLARIMRRARNCPQRLGTALTRWEVRPVAYPVRTPARAGEARLDTLVSEHFSRAAAAESNSMERMYFTREIGYTRWERWQNAAVQDRAEDARQAGQLSGRCTPGVGAPADGGRWVMTDCRQWTQIVPAAAPGGDPPGFWLDRLRLYPETAAIFAR